MAPTCKPGDLIEINRGSYQHWAVYIGQNEVVHLVNTGSQSSGSFKSLSSSSSSSSSNKTGNVLREKFTDVVGKHTYHVSNLLDKKYKAREPSIIVTEACAMVGELQYNVATYNCEHFATEMRYGKAESLQVIIAVIALAAGAPVVALGAPVVAVAAGALAVCKVLFCSSSSS